MIGVVPRVYGGVSAVYGAVVSLYGTAFAVDGSIHPLLCRVLALHGSIQAEDGAGLALDGPGLAVDGPDQALHGPVLVLHGPDQALYGPGLAVDAPDQARHGPVLATDGPDQALHGPVLALDAPDQALHGPVLAVDGPDHALLRAGLAVPAMVLAVDGPVLALFASLLAEQRARLRRLRGLCPLRPSALALLPNMKRLRGIQLAAALALLASLGGCLTQVALDEMEYPSVTFEQPHHAWLNADGETISVVMSAAHTEGERLYTSDLPQSYDWFGACPAVVRYRYDPDSETLRVVSWDRPMWDDQGHVCWKDPSELVMPTNAHPVRIDGDRLVRHGSSPRFLLEKGPETRQKVAAGVLLPFAVVLDVALAPVYGLGFVITKLFF